MLTLEENTRPLSHAAIWAFNTDTLADTRYYIHRQEKRPDDIGEFGEWKTRTPDSKRAGRKRSGNRTTLAAYFITQPLTSG